MSIKNKSLAIERLIALWALNECGLGGLMHAFSSPFTGIIVGGISILLISLIALFAKNIWPTLLKALSIVLLVKLSVSPHSPITAYFAVSFQTLVAALLFSTFSVKKITILCLTALSFLESALQKLFTLTILYGNSLWDAIDVYGEWVSENLEFFHLTLSSKHLIWLFVLFYFCSGILVGFLIIRTISMVRSNSQSTVMYIPKSIDVTKTKDKRGFLQKKQVLFWALTLVIIAIPFIFFNTTTNGYQRGIYLLVRSFLILIVWYLIIGPILLKGLNRILLKSKSKYKTDIQNTLDLLPYLRDIVGFAWQESKPFKGFNKMEHFLAKSIVYSIYFKKPEL